jgi:hypothetical protein
MCATGNQSVGTCGPISMPLQIPVDDSRWPTFLTSHFLTAHPVRASCRRKRRGQILLLSKLMCAQFDVQTQLPEPSYISGGLSSRGDLSFTWQSAKMRSVDLGRSLTNVRNTSTCHVVRLAETCMPSIGATAYLYNGIVRCLCRASLESWASKRGPPQRMSEGFARFWSFSTAGAYIAVAAYHGLRCSIEGRRSGHLRSPWCVMPVR